jgi:NADH-quinone oxidoreductase subunit C
VPDAPGLELIRGEIEAAHPGAVIDTGFAQDRAVLSIEPSHVLDVLAWLRDAPGQGYRFLSSLHAADYLPAEPRFAVHYELLNRDRVERIRVKALLADPAAGQTPVAAGPVAAGDPPPPAVAEASSGLVPPTTPPAAEALPQIDSCVELFPTAEFQEREAYDFFGIVFKGHPDFRRILLPEDYVGWPQRRDFPIGGEPVTFTYSERAYG